MSQQENIPPFYVGQRVVAVMNSPRGFFKKGQEFVVQGIHFFKCCHQDWVISIGIDGIDRYCACACGTRFVFPGSNVFMWHVTSLFAPIESQFQSITLEKVLETETPLIGVN